jgi:GT2 family glycosyltransferase
MVAKTERSIGIVILHWNNFADTQACLRSLLKIKTVPFRIWLVDNHSTDGSLEKLQVEFSEVTYVCNASNLGFAAGNNIGIDRALEAGCQMVLLLNNDTEVEANFLSELLKTIVSRPAVGIVCPKILFLNPKNIIWYAGGFLNKIAGCTYHRGTNQQDQGQYNTAKQIDFATGCAMLVKREVFDQIGKLDPDYFNSHEDADFCLRASRAGFACWYVPSAIVYHKLARSMGGIRSPFYLYYRTRNHLLFMKKRGFKTPLFWPHFIYVFCKRFFGSFVIGRPRGALATLQGVYDFYAKKWGRGSGNKFR